MYINFGTKLNIDNSFYTNLKQTNCNEIVQKTNELLNLPEIKKLISADELTLYGKKTPTGECVKIKYGKEIIEIFSKDGVATSKPIVHILYKICHEHNKFPRISKLTDTIKELSKSQI